MNRTIRCTIANCLPALLLALIASAAHAQWTAPTPDELKMTAQSEVPGAPAVYLFREEITEDKQHTWSIYARIKVLTERGKDFANVELKQYSGSDDSGYSISDIQGRTIHPDGTVIPFAGKPFEKLIEKSRDYKVMAKVFTLPDVWVGSILEYRYKLRYDDNRFIAPAWFVQSDLYTRAAHYLWWPTDEQLISHDEGGEQLTSTVAWTPILPAGSEVKQSRGANGVGKIELNVQNVPPVVEEEYMPPLQSMSYRVLFYYTAYRTAGEYWKHAGKGWSKTTNKFIGPGNKVKDAVKELVAPTDTEDQKLHKLYAAVMKIDNTSYNRSRSAAEDKAHGLDAPKSTDDIWVRKRGTDDQIAELFVALVRAAGMKADIIAVTNRSRAYFLPNYLSFSQFDDYLAIVNVGGKDLYFDPGQRYCPYGQLAWKHTQVQGIRQSADGAAFGETPGMSYKESRSQRVANLTMDEHGEVTGTVSLAWTGSGALRWRQSSLTGDATSLNNELKTTLEQMLPGGMDVKVLGVDHIEDYEQPLLVRYEVKGAIGSPTGKRLLIPADIFVASSKPTFPHEKREVPIAFEYARSVVDAVRINLPPSLSIQSAPANERIPLQTFAIYAMNTETTPNSITVRRELDLGNIFYKLDEYPALRTFYNKLESKDQEPAVLKVAPQATPAGN
jgi:hypothetical protein